MNRSHQPPLLFNILVEISALRNKNILLLGYRRYIQIQHGDNVIVQSTVHNAALVAQPAVMYHSAYFTRLYSSALCVGFAYGEVCGWPSLFSCLAQLLACVGPWGWFPVFSRSGYSPVSKGPTALMTDTWRGPPGQRWGDLLQVTRPNRLPEGLCGCQSQPAPCGNRQTDRPTDWCVLN